MKHTLSLTVALCAAASVWGNPNWKMHPTFDEAITRMIDTGNNVYFIGRTQLYNKNISEISSNVFSLFRYDKEADELMALSKDNLLSSNVVSCVEYSPEKKMLVVVNSDHDIDLIYENGKSENIPAYKFATVSSGKDVNSIFIDAAADRIYLSTGFGYVALNDKKLEVAESRIYGEPILGMSRVGDRLLLLTEKSLLSAPVSSPRFNLSDYEEVMPLTKGEAITNLSEERTIVIDATGKPHTYRMAEPDGNGIKVTDLFTGGYVNMHHNSEGVMVGDHNWIVQFYPDGTRKSIMRNDEDLGLVASTNDMREIWYGLKRRGISSKRYNPDGEVKWTLTRDFMLPNSPSPYKATNMTWHKDYGMLVVNHGYDNNFTESINSPILLSGYKDGMWSNLSPVYTWPQGVASLMNPNGLAVDPDNTDLVYFGSVRHGVERINMSDGSDILHLSRTSDPFRDQPGYVEIVPDQKGGPSPSLNGGNSWKSQCMFSAPQFDAYGNMWTAHCDHDDQYPLQTHLFCWEAADRRASVDAASYRPMKLMRLPDLPTSNFQYLRTLMVPRQQDVLVWTVSRGKSPMIVVFHTNGTPSDPSDDKLVKLAIYVDQDGTTFEPASINDILEDPITGNVWVGHGSGVFYFNPMDVLDGKLRVTRVKVARNDGTNLADYLLNQVPVNKIAIDGQGRKWFATSGAGVVCTSSDGRTIEEELTTENSLLPDDIVYGLGYVPSTNSMLFSTDLGIAEYYLSGAGGSGENAEARAYPNPVRPDYFGYVTIDGLAEGSLVKIVDSRGNLVKELGQMSGGELKWDVTDMSFRRVGSGVYFILSSGNEAMSNFANVGKILVVN